MLTDAKATAVENFVKALPDVEQADALHASRHFVIVAALGYFGSSMNCRFLRSAILGDSGIVS